MGLNWFASKNSRLAADMCKHVRKILNAQRDILSPQAIKAVEAALSETKTALAENANDELIQKQINKLETAANAWLKPYPNSGIRENVEVVLVALAVAMGIRTFFFQPFKIPTGSMQPTLFGATWVNLKEKPGEKPPGIIGRIYEGCAHGTFYHYQKAEEDGRLVAIGPPEHFLKFINTVSIVMQYPSGKKKYTFWMTPEDSLPSNGLTGRSGLNYAAIENGQTFHKGDDIVNFKDVVGDHLFVDRISFNFRRPQRGEIIVFETRGVGNAIYSLPPDQFYIKRMVAMGNEKVQIGNDRHLIIDGKRLDQSTPHFENVYSFDPKVAPAENTTPESPWCGHLNQAVADKFGLYPSLAPLFPDAEASQVVRPDYYMVMGDNTANSLDSRKWGDFSRTNVIGKYFFVYWPFTPRFGCSLR